MLHGAGPALRTFLARASTWQRLAVGGAMVAIGAVLVAFGDVRAGLVGLVGVVLLSTTGRRHLGRRAVAAPTHPATPEPGTEPEERP